MPQELQRQQRGPTLTVRGSNRNHRFVSYSVSFEIKFAQPWLQLAVAADRVCPISLALSLLASYSRVRGEKGVRGQPG